jgi:hypothetical protein
MRYTLQAKCNCFIFKNNHNLTTRFINNNYTKKIEEKYSLVLA